MAAFRLGKPLKTIRIEFLVRMPHKCRSSWTRALCAMAALAVLALARLNGLTLTDLLNDQKMTPKRFANYFGDFDFEAHDYVQDPNAFLSARAGDCQDYATLADYVLARRGYHTRLIHIRLVGRIAHAVCYVTESRGYLDYNDRVYFINLQKCGPRIRAIADKVAESFEGNWTSASEFTYDLAADRKHFGRTVVKTDPPEQDADAGTP